MSAQALPWSTNESAKAWAKRIKHRSLVFGDDVTGEVYVCPRCGWESRPMRWKLGAARLGLEHDTRCV